MNTIEHPAAYITASHVSAIREWAKAAEDLNILHPEQLRIIYHENWFRLFVPKQYGGLQSSLPQALRLEEALAWADGAVGWTVTLCAGAGWFVGFLQPTLSDLIFSDDKVCLAGSGKANAVATKTTGGYNITGSWDYATGSNLATAFTANCLIAENDVVLRDEQGQPLLRSFLFLKEDVQVLSNWKRIGMKATGSNSFMVDDLFVSHDRSFIIQPDHAVLKDVIYQYPFLQFAETTLAVNSSGMAMRFLDLCELVSAEKNNPVMQAVLARAITTMKSVREEFYKMADTSWLAITSNSIMDDALLNRLSNISKQLAVTARQVVDELYPFCGMQAANPDTELSRVWRNLHTASQHAIFNF